VGKFDVTVTIGSSYSTKRKESFDTAMQLVSANPALMGVIGDLVIEQSDMPMAAAIAERLKKTLPPALQSDDKDSHIPPAVAAQVNQLKQQAGTVIEHLTQIVQKLEEEKAAKSQELAAKVEIARMDNTVKLRIAEMTAKNAEAEARAEALAQRIEGLLQHAHEVGLMAEEQAHEKEMAERQHQQGLEAGAQQHAQGMESAAAQAALEPQPEAGA
jgi:glutamate-1-semialdehyde aminotransferase